MKILLAGNYYPQPDSGAAGTEVQTVAALRRLGHEVDCIWRDDLPHRIRHGNLHLLLELPPGYRDAINRQCSQKDYDAIHVNQPECWLAARDHQQFARTGVFVQRSHGWEGRVVEQLGIWRKRMKQPEKRFLASIPTAILRRLLSRHLSRSVRYCDGTVVSSSLCREFIIQHYDADPDRIVTIPQAAPDVFRESAIAPLNPDRQNRVLYVGQFAYVKGPNLLAEAILQVADRLPHAQFTWVCAAEHHNEARRLLGSAAGRCTLRNWVNQDDLRNIYDDHGIFLFPSLFEGFGKAFLEAMARGLCVIASNEGGMRDIIRHGENGFLCPVGDANAMATVAEKAMTDVGLVQRVSTAARETACSFSWERVATELVGFYQRLQKLKYVA